MSFVLSSIGRRIGPKGRGRGGRHGKGGRTRACVSKHHKHVYIEEERGIDSEGRERERERDKNEVRKGKKEQLRIELWMRKEGKREER